MLDLLKEFESFKPYIDFLGLFDENTTPLGDAVMRKGEDAFFELIMKSAPTETAVDQLIYHAMRLGRHDVVRILLEEAQRRGWASARTLVASWFDGCHLQSLNVASDEDLRVQALHMAAYDGNVGLIRVLLDYGGAINGLDSQSQPPLVYALRHLARRHPEPAKATTMIIQTIQ